MSQHQIPRWAVVAVAAVLLLVIAGAVHSAGWSQGFTMGLLAGGADSAQLAPYMAYRTGYGVHPWGIGGFFGAIFRVGFFLLFLAFIAKLFGFWRWRMHGPHGRWGHHGPWQRESQSHGEEPAEPSPKEEGRGPQNTAWTSL